MLSALEETPAITAEALGEVLWNGIETEWSDYASMSRDGASRYRYEADGYILELDRDGDIFVIASLYYTECGFCSPCASMLAT